MPKGVNQGARPDVISPKPVSGQLLVGRVQIQDHWLVFRWSSFLDDTPPIHAKPC